MRERGESQRHAGKIFLSIFRLTQIGCSMFRPTEAIVSCSNLITAATCEHTDYALTPTRLQSIGGAESQVNLAEAVQTSLDPRCLWTQGLGPHRPGQHSLEHRCRCLASPNPVASPRRHHLAGRCTTRTSSRASDVGSSNVRDSNSATVGCGGPRVTTVRLPTLTADDATKGGRGDVVGHVDTTIQS
jgi:hypothetical protein